MCALRDSECWQSNKEVAWVLLTLPHRADISSQLSLVWMQFVGQFSSTLKYQTLTSDLYCSTTRRSTFIIYSLYNMRIRQKAPPPVSNLLYGFILVTLKTKKKIVIDSWDMQPAEQEVCTLTSWSLRYLLKMRTEIPPSFFVGGPKRQHAVCLYVDGSTFASF